MMRPLAGSEALQPRSRKPSLTGPSPLSDTRSTSPVTFFLGRASHENDTSSSSEVMRGQGASSVQSLADSLNGLAESTSTVVTKNDADESGQSSPRWSALKGKGHVLSQRSPFDKDQTQSSQQEPLTPLLIPSDTSSLPSSPKSTSSRSLRPSEADSVAGDAGSQAILSSGDEGPAPEASVQPAEAAPQLIMPSIKMPSRRPFSERGKQIGNLKILIAGGRGVGKTSLIKSIVQLCEDIVHVDPLPPGELPAVGSSSTRRQVCATPEGPHVFEINASTKPYPSWWSDIEDGKILPRRRSTGDTILDRNVCFVDAASPEIFSTVSQYMRMHLRKAMKAPSTANREFAALLSGSGGSQVDVIFYMLSKDTLDLDISQMKALSELGNVVPLISKSDLLSPEDIETLKVETRSRFDATMLPRMPVFGASDPQSRAEDASAPYTVSSAAGPDHETMDASLLMSPDYVQPLIPSELAVLVQEIFESETISYLRHFAAKKLIAWQAAHPRPSKIPSPAQPNHSFSPRPSGLTSPIPYAVSNSCVLVPFASDQSLDPASNKLAMVRLAEHALEEERLAQVRLSKWANDLQNSLQRERERFEKLARGERATWLVERMSEEARDGRLSVLDKSGVPVKAGNGDEECPSWASAKYSIHDPLGLLSWSDNVKSRSWIAFQVLGSFGMIGGLAFWFAKTWGLNEWAQGWSWNGFGLGWNNT